VEQIWLNAPGREHGEKLVGSLNRAFGAELVEAADEWRVNLGLSSAAALLLRELFDGLGEWLTSIDQASIELHFGDRSYVLSRPVPGQLADAAEFLMERVLQLETALESRIVIEQAKGKLSAHLSVSPEEAFTLLRAASRTEQTKIRDLAAQVVEGSYVPLAILTEVQKAAP
jgi:ANTAR domain